MPGRRFILDSDDEDDGDQEEPTQVIVSRHSPHRNANGPESTIDLTDSPCCAADVPLENLSSTGSTGNPSIKILDLSSLTDIIQQKTCRGKFKTPIIGFSNQAPTVLIRYPLQIILCLNLQQCQGSDVGKRRWVQLDQKRRS